MPKFMPRKSGMKNKEGIAYITSYDAHLPKSKLIEAGFIDEDGKVSEYEAVVDGETIILKKIK